MAQWSKALVLRGPRFYTQHPPGGSQPYITLAPWDGSNDTPPFFVADYYVVAIIFISLQALGTHRVQSHLDKYSYM